jgi:hypothetical protein
VIAWQPRCLLAYVVDALKGQRLGSFVSKI